MQPPTLTGVRVRSVRDAHKVFHAVYSGLLPRATRRLDTAERNALQSGYIYVWEERARDADVNTVGIERWTDGLHWSASRVRDEFLFYHEREPPSSKQARAAAAQSQGPSATPNSYMYYGTSLYQTPVNHQPDLFVKQTYSALVNTPRGERKWHLTAYFTQGTVDRLRTVDETPFLMQIQVPHNMYRSARTSAPSPSGSGQGYDRGRSSYEERRSSSFESTSSSNRSQPAIPPSQYAPSSQMYTYPPPVVSPNYGNGRYPTSQDRFVPQPGRGGMHLRDMLN